MKKEEKERQTKIKKPKKRETKETEIIAIKIHINIKKIPTFRDKKRP